MAEQTRLRITAWPGGPVPVPPVLAFERVELDGEWLVSSGAFDYRDVPPELYLRDAADVDLASAAEIAAFTHKHGRLAPLHGGTDDLPGSTKAVEHAIRLHAHHRRYDNAAAGEAFRRVHVDAVGFRLRVLRNLTAHAVAFREGDHEADAWPDCPDDAEAWRRFTEYANTALRPFHARIYVDIGDHDFDVGAPRCSLFEAAVLQLVNDLAEEAEYHRCEHCGRLFARQVGRSQHYSRSKGVKFCTPSCSRAASVRAYRQRQTKTKHDEGDSDGER